MTEIKSIFRPFEPLLDLGLPDTFEPLKQTALNPSVIVSRSGEFATAKGDKRDVSLDVPKVKLRGQESTSNLQSVKAALDDVLKVQAGFKSVFSGLVEDGKSPAKGKERLSFSSIEDFAIFLGSKLSHIKELQNKITLEDIQRAKLAGQETMKENDEKLQASLKAGAEAKKSGLAARIFGWISAVASIIVGAVMVATGVGAVAGALMIAGGVVGVVSCALQECAKAGLISKEVMAVLGPVMTAIEALVAVVSAVVTFGGSAAGALAKLFSKAAPEIAQMAQKVANVLKNVAAMGVKGAASAAGGLSKLMSGGNTLAQLGNGTTQATNQGLNAKSAITQADLLKSRVELESEQEVQNKLTQALQQNFESLQSALEALYSMLAKRGVSEHNLARSPKTI